MLLAYRDVTWACGFARGHLVESIIEFFPGQIIRGGAFLWERGSSTRVDSRCVVVNFWDRNSYQASSTASGELSILPFVSVVRLDGGCGDFFDSLFTSLKTRL